MASTKYTYSISSDTLNGAVSLSDLKTELVNDATIILAPDYINASGDVLDIWMKDEMPDDIAGASALLDAAVAAHTGIPTEVIEVQGYKPVFLSTSVKLAGFGFKFTATKTTTTSEDYKLTQDLRFRGGTVETKDNVMGDTATLQIVDVDNILGAGAGYVVATYFENWNIPQNGSEIIIEPTMGDIVLQNLYLRLTYISVGGTNDVTVAVNMRAYRDA
jgi:hypothetical protein